MEVPTSSRVTVSEVVPSDPEIASPWTVWVAGGRSSVNQAPVTGESVPVDKGSSDDVFAGTVERRGALEGDDDARRRRPHLDHDLVRRGRLQTRKRRPSSSPNA